MDLVQNFSLTSSGCILGAMCEETEEIDFLAPLVFMKESVKAREKERESKRGSYSHSALCPKPCAAVGSWKTT